MKCKYCGEDGFKNKKGLSVHRRYNRYCFNLWKKEQDEIKENTTLVKCEICGKKMRNISNTHLKKHGITQQQYKNMFPDSNIFAEGLLDIQKENRESTLKERYFDNDINCHDSGSLDFFIRKYGGEGKELYDKKCQKISFSSSLEGYIEKYGEEEGIVQYNIVCENRTGVGNLDWYIEKYGEEGQKLYKESCENKSYGHTLDWYIEKYGDDGEIIFKNVNKKKGLTLENFIRKYGKEEGVVKYTQYWKNKNQKCFYSELASSMFVEIDSNIDHNLQYATKEDPKEYGIFLPKNKRYTFVDCYDRTSNKIIEFFGNYWHANPEIYSEHDYILFPNKSEILASHIWGRDEERIEEIKELRECDVLVVWEKDYLEDKDGTIQKCIDFLLN